jgi:hypothetical protein
MDAARNPVIPVSMAGSSPGHDAFYHLTAKRRFIRAAPRHRRAMPCFLRDLACAPPAL